MSTKNVAKRDGLKASIIRIQQWCNGISNSTSEVDIIDKLDKLESKWIDFQETHKAILEITGSSELPFQTIEADQTEKLVDAIRIRLAEAQIKVSAKKETGTISKQININSVALADSGAGCSKEATHKEYSFTSNIINSAGSASNNLPRKVAIAEQGLFRVQIWANQANSQNTNLVVVRGYLGLLEQHWNAFMDAAQNETNTEELVNTHLDIAEKEILYITTKAILENLITIFTTTTNTNTTRSIDVKLPRIELPKFNGNYDSWSSFFDLFSSLVDKNNSLTGSQKLHYLKSSMEGQACQIIRSYTITDANYAEAWNALRTRFENKRLIVNSHLKRILDLPKLKLESASALRKCMDSFTESIRALNALDRPTDYWDDLLVYIFVENMDSETRRLWELSLADAMPTFAQLRTFVETRCRSLDAAGVTQKPPANPRMVNSTQYKPHTLIGTSDISPPPPCPVCKESHFVYSCPQFLKLTVFNRHKETLRLGICFNCLRKGHLTSNCNSGPCKSCQGRHHTLLHYNNNESPSNNSNLSSYLGVNRWNTEILLSTALVLVECHDQTYLQTKVLLDSGSQASFITDRLFRKLQIIRKKASIPVSGLGQHFAGTSRGYANINIRSTTDTNVLVNFNALILENITKRIPSNPVDTSKLSLPSKLQLADPKFHEPSDIDILIGADIYGSIFLDGIKQSQNGITARRTIFGWVLSGPIIEATKSLRFNTSSSLCSHLNLEQTLKKFWEIESLDTTPKLTHEELQCEQIFASTYSRTESGRFVVTLPFKLESPQLGNSKRNALSSLASLERRFVRQPTLRKEYADFIHEYASLGHMELTTTEPLDKDCYYLPHHAVFKESTTTKLRVVFDASRSTHLGPSLNDKLLVGPKLQDDLIDILTRFRTYKYAFTCDIAKMYRQVLVEDKQCDFQRILWRDSERESIKCYRLKTVTYGTASASYLATKALQQLAKDESNKFSLASQVALSDFYVDDLISGSNDLSEALQMQKELGLLMNAGGMQLRKWTSNCNDILEAVPLEHRECTFPLEIHGEESVKTLGLFWYPNLDYFGFKVDLGKTIEPLTKRVVLSQASKLFDPLGLLAPVIISAKIFLQKLWINGLDWDEELSTELSNTWNKYKMELPLLNELKVPRWFGDCNNNLEQIHGFCDASEVAYGAAVFIRSVNNNGTVCVTLVASKTRVAPVKKLSIPRLELCGAHLLATLLDHVKLSLRLPNAQCFAWTDSTVVLAWIQKPSHIWKTFVANRVSEIQSLTNPTIWRHVPGTDNPADCASRGVYPSEIINCSLWFNGPRWLVFDEIKWPIRNNIHTTEIEKRSENVSLIVSVAENPLELLEQHSTLEHLRRVTAYILRFVSNCRTPRTSRRSGPLTTLELKQSLHYWIKMVQRFNFGPEIAKCLSKSSVSPSSSLKSLNPFIDTDGLLKVGGRLQAANITYNRKHPIILPKKNHLTQLLVSDYHSRNLHSGIQLTLSSLRQLYWIIGARTTVRDYIHRCVTCVRHRKTSGAQMMGNLPQQRLASTRAFLTCGVDYAGPLILRLHSGRCNRTTKAYIALFVCFSTKAVHLELVSDLSSGAFLACFRRFTARRGKCADIYSDCGTNFVGADKDLQELHAAVKIQLSDPVLGNTLANDGTNWHFNPPAAPNMGGLWEAGVKSVKHHLRRIVGTTPMTFEEVTTVLAQIEACLNSRPITQLTDDPEDFEALTPGHFIIGGPLNALPDPSLDHLKISRLSRWQMCQKIVQHFWNRWRNEYLNSLQQRTKWWKKQENVEVGQLAFIVDDNQPPAKWTLARVTEVFTGPDGLVRVLNLKHKNGIIKRPISKICLLPKM